MRNALLTFFPELVTEFGDISALLAADFYDMLRDVPPSASSFQASYARPVDPAKAEGTARWAIGALFDGDERLFMSQILGGTQRLVMQRGRDTVVHSSSRDSVRTAFARIPSGSDVCDFCIMTASRGAVYRDAVSAGDMNEYHDNCHCSVIPVRRRSDFPDGYDPKDLLTQY